MNPPARNLTIHRIALMTCALAVFASLTALGSVDQDTVAIPPQPYFANVNRAVDALASLGAPIAKADADQLAALTKADDQSAVESAEKILNRYTLARLNVDSGGYTLATAGGAKCDLVEQGWQVFLLRIGNPSGSTAQLQVADEEWAISSQSTGASRAGVPDTVNFAPHIKDAWLKEELYEGPPFAAKLSGLGVEYRVIQLFSRDRGQRKAKLSFGAVKDLTAVWTASPLYWAEQNKKGINLEFNCLPSRDVTLSIKDSDGRGCMASITIKGVHDRIYPLQAMRLAPDMFFQPQVYRADGETVRLPDGEYTVEAKRGPEYLSNTQKVVIGAGNYRIDVQLRRWIDPAQWGWYSGDTHIHAGGCLHYACPTEGVSPETMIRHVRGEGLSIGDVLTWGPSWYYQKQFFTGQAESPAATLEHPELQVANNVSLQPRATPTDDESLLRYDVEVSGFPSSACGHLVLLNLKEQDYPGTKLIEDWPSWNLPILKWARGQGAVAGYAHCGIGMVVDSEELPNYEIPPMDGIGTQEAIVDVTHGLVDFLSGCNTKPVAELNAWYHMLNCGFRMALIGETDYPCISGERPGIGRSYVQLNNRPLGDAGYDAWIQGLKQGRLYCGDGRSHFLKFTVDGKSNGEGDIELNTAGTVQIQALVAARLEAEPPADIEVIKHSVLNGWHLENARIGITRNVPVELIVNGVSVDRAVIVADGTQQEIRFKTPIARSSWVALRILPSSHTSPVFIVVDGKPIRASKKSAQWCRACVDKLWEVKSPFIRASERPAASEAYDHARKVYDEIIAECEESR